MDVRPKRHWYQFTVGGLLILTTIVSLPLGWFVYERNEVWKEQQAADQFHKLIRDATMAVRPKAIGKTLEEVKSQFSDAGYQQISYDEFLSEYRYNIRENAWTASNGTQHQLIAIAEVDKKNNRVASIEAGLIGKPNLTYQQVLEQRLYPPKSAIGLCLTHPTVKKAAIELPILKEVQINYELTDHPDGVGGMGRTSAYVHYTFFVVLTFTSIDNESGRRLWFDLASNLDPVQDRNGRSVMKAFTPSTALGEIEYGGGPFWGIVDVDDE